MDRTVRFGACELSVDRVELRRDGAVVAIEPQVFDVLAHLVANRHRVVPKHELLDRVWSTRFVSDSALTSRIKSARRAVGDNGRDQWAIRTVHGRGFRFVADVADVAVVAPQAAPSLDAVLEEAFPDADALTRQRLRVAARAIAEAAVAAAVDAVADARGRVDDVAS